MQFFSFKSAVIILSFFITSLSQAQFSLTKLQVDYQEKPLGIDIHKPVFSWQMKAAKNVRGQLQKAYQIEVTDENGGYVWNSDKVTNGSSIGITYQGAPLKATTRYTWTLTVWDQSGKKANAQSWFETGLMNPDPKLSAWSGADWIGGASNDLVFYSHYLTVFKLNYDVQLDQKSKSVRAGFIFGANDERLMDKNMNTKGMVNKKDASYIKTELDISGINAENSGKARLNIYRVGYAQNDSDTKPFKTLEIPLSIINNTNKYHKHQIYASSIFGVFDFYVDGNDAAHNITVNDKGEPSSINLNPEGWGADYIAYPAVADIGFAMEKGQKAFFSNVTVMNNRAPSNILFKEELTGQTYTGIFNSAKNTAFSVINGHYEIGGAQQPVKVIANPTQNATPMLRTEFNTSGKTISKARLYATARGIYELYLNGTRVGNDYFNPGLTQYNKTHSYQTYDVTDMVLKNGGNALGAILSEGWWSGNITFTGNHWNFFGDRQSLLARLIITYTDGSEQIITTNPTWKYYNNGPVRYGSFFQGEVYDANKEHLVAGWSNPGFDDSKWTTARIVDILGTTYNQTTTAQGQDINLDFSGMELIGMPGVKAGIVKTLKPVSVEEVRPGVFVYDMGQNMVGFPKIEFEDTHKGDTIMVRYAEVKYPDLEQYSANKGMIMLENMRAAMVRDIYYCKGSNDILQPRFTFHGYRFLEITGIKKALPLDKVTGLVLSSIDTITSGYETSNPLVNKLWQNITWSTRGNFLHIPTDTPARNERMGWSGDISVFSKTATYLANVEPFLKRHMLAMRDLQYKNGRFTDTAPVTDAFGGVLWGSAGLIVAWETYQQYGDINLLAEHYEAMKHYIAYLKTRVDPVTGAVQEGPLGDWLSPENYKTDDTILWDAYYAYDLDIMRQVAVLLGKETDARFFEQEYTLRKAHFNTTHIDASTGKTIHSGHRFSWGYGIAQDKLPQKGGFSDTQASYAVPLAFNVIDEQHKTKAAQNFAAAIARKNLGEDGVLRPEYSLMTGFIGTASVSSALSLNGYDAEAYKLLQQTSYPSWLYSVENGATTIWERLNSYTKEEGFGKNNSMNSFNHYSFGAAGAWMLNYSLGIERGTPGFKSFILQPTPDPTGQMTFAKGYYDSMYGKIVSEWEVRDTQVVYTFVVPENTTATLYLEADDVKKVSESGRPLKHCKGVKFIGYSNGQLQCTLASGHYTFTVRK